MGERRWNSCRKVEDRQDKSARVGEIQNRRVEEKQNTRVEEIWKRSWRLKK